MNLLQLDKFCENVQSLIKIVKDKVINLVIIIYEVDHSFDTKPQLWGSQ